MVELNQSNIVAGRTAVDAYRDAHRQLHSTPWHKGVPEEHTPLLDKLLADLRKQRFNSLEGFSNASDELNVRELGFTSREDFEAKATEADKANLMEMWQ